jgi:hypothetical protein
MSVSQPTTVPPPFPNQISRTKIYLDGTNVPLSSSIGRSMHETSSSTTTTTPPSVDRLPFPMRRNGSHKHTVRGCVLLGAVAVAIAVMIGATTQTCLPCIPMCPIYVIGNIRLLPQSMARSRPIICHHPTDMAVVRNPHGKPITCWI